MPNISRSGSTRRTVENVRQQPLRPFVRLRARPRPMSHVSQSRRMLLSAAVGLPLTVTVKRVFATPPHPDIRWFRIAEEMKRQAESGGDQSNGPVLVFAHLLGGL